MLLKNINHKDEVSRITFWLNNWLIRGRTSYSLLFDRNDQPKPAFYKVIALAK